MQYIICEYTEEYDWCLFRVVGSSLDRAKIVLEKCQREYPNKKFEIQHVEEKNCWWNSYID